MELVKVEQEADSAFKKPVRPKKKQKILDEDSYLEALDSIIQRDFFPDLEKLRTQQQILEAGDDVDKLREIEITLRRRSSSVRKTASELRPTGFETPRVDGKEGETGKQEKEEEGAKDPLNDLSLDQFLASHTSEDNASFSDIVDKMNERKREKYKWLYDREEKAQASQQLLLEGGSGAALALPYTAANALMYHPEGVPLSTKEEQDLSKLSPKEIKHTNTRFVENPFAKSKLPEKEKMGQMQVQSQVWSTLDSGEKQLLEYRRAIKEGAIQSFDLDALRGTPRAEPQSPQINGYGFVTTPAPAPGDSPFVTWGTVDSTPLLLSALNDLPMPTHTPGPSFEIHGMSQREKVAQALSEKAIQEIKKRKRANTPQRRQPASPVVGGFASPATPARKGVTPASPLVRSGQTPQLSAAGKRLASERMKKTSVNSDLQLRASYSSPSPLRKGARQPTPSKLSIKTPSPSLATPNKLRPVTPKPAFATISSTTLPTAQPAKDSLTDDLLNI